MVAVAIVSEESLGVDHGPASSQQLSGVQICTDWPSLIAASVICATVSSRFLSGLDVFGIFSAYGC